MSQVETNRDGRVVVLTMKRPDAGNRITQQMAEELTAGLDAARRDPTVAGCVLTGHGDIFCLGGDYQGAGPTTAGRMEFGRAHIDLLNEMARLGKPLVAAVNGNAHAGGFGLVVGCDLAFVAEDATLGLPEAAHGLFPFLALAIVRDALPKKVLFDIVYNARLMDAHEARSLHLVNKVVEKSAVVAQAVWAVEQANSGNPDVLALGRDLYYTMRGLSPAEALDKSRFALGSALGARSERSQI
ncbi:MAG: enoyl-CoA hydratase/isomerase family protein [Bosea sp.]|jgi:enoyl-CoA hydratase/carnithine racemase|uniref:enoyl-CoA hydratase-related protein n=1 Tax=Bosea sp. (in: a-proteobacteria) TaxID=1871050 RepID=UPI000836AC8A|nr:enoyl-CoA hydratase/isomerase family protein [Bosea sp. (in: a-proteobacteria)]MCP4736920.1 enoyl-CoA hydratase/isomerase family protein [Bosea sp. (in: a-proteobacteria)]MDX3805035.1 enoyl-CoA hydratase/isomerase family protein [Bosea sp. (in: a-proteobacteria)]